LNGKWAALQVAVLRIVFDRDRRSVATDPLHAQVSAFLDMSRAEGLDTPVASLTLNNSAVTGNSQHRPAS
jgi:hypothetical protein